MKVITQPINVRELVKLTSNLRRLIIQRRKYQSLIWGKVIRRGNHGMKMDSLRMMASAIRLNSGSRLRVATWTLWASRRTSLPTTRPRRGRRLRRFRSTFVPGPRLFLSAEALQRRLPCTPARPDRSLAFTEDIWYRSPRNSRAWRSLWPTKGTKRKSDRPSSSSRSNYWLCLWRKHRTGRKR